MTDRRLKSIAEVAIPVILYVLIGNARSIEPNPFIPGSVIAVYMVVPVVAGILFGCRTGFLVGILGAFFNALSPAGSAFEFVSIIPHGLMGAAAGCLRGKFPTPFVASTILVGHSLNILAYVSIGLMEVSPLTAKSFWYGLAYESLIDIMTIYVIVTVYRMGFAPHNN
jgi:uncharacterized membrane protein